MYSRKLTKRFWLKKVKLYFLWLHLYKWKNITTEGFLGENLKDCSGDVSPLMSIYEKISVFWLVSYV